MKCDFPEYRVYHSRSEFEGSDVVEFFPGAFAGETTWWNEGSAYVREEGLEPFETVIRSVAPGFDRYGETRLIRPQLITLALRLDRMMERFCAAKTLYDLKSVDNKIEVKERNFYQRKTEMVRMCADLAAIVTLAINRKTALWILGV